MSTSSLSDTIALPQRLYRKDCSVMRAGTQRVARPDWSMARHRALRTLFGALASICLVGTVTVSLMQGNPSALPRTLPDIRLFSRTSPAIEVDPSDWNLVLVNAAHRIEPCQPELTQLRNGQAVDSRCYPSLQQMFDDARAAGLLPLINSSWRSREEQQRILDETIAAYVEQGYGEEAARTQALRTVAEPGASEHETGLAIDVTSELHTNRDDSAVHAWMAKNSWRYGWILRYPAGKEDITGIDNEPWHFRYVGPDAARVMHEYGLCLEEYLGL